MEEAKRDEKTEDFATSIETFLSEHLVVDSDFFVKTKEDTDWMFVIRGHALLEATLNTVITAHMGKAFVKIIRAAEVGDPDMGKLAFAKPLDLLGEDHRGFIRQFSRLRNAFTHEIKCVGWRIAEWMSWIDDNKRRNFVEGIAGVFPHTLEVYGEETEREVFVRERPRLAVTSGLFTVIASIHSISSHKKGVAFTPKALRMKLGARHETPKSRTTALE